ncbi:MAG: sodium ion-translocating decarboxylase subunit beta [Clostridiales bacterium]|nr:sodium ion-translocating decarboxylase subunit beta [Clostridiales bacterium]
MGIIGGADGPTAIFVSTPPGGWIVPGVIALAAIMLPVGVACWLRRGKRKHTSTEE